MRLLSRDDIARHCGVKVNTVDKWKARHPDFPVPVRYFGQSPARDSDDVQLWCEKHGRMFA